MKFLAIVPPKPGGRFERGVAALSKKFPALSADLASLFADLVGPPSKPIPWGTRVVRLRGLGQGQEGLKVRMPSSDMGKGSSKAFRVILVQRQADHWQPVALYAKGDQEDIPLKEVLAAIDEEFVLPEPAAVEPQPEGDSASPAPEQEPPIADEP